MKPAGFKAHDVPNRAPAPEPAWMANLPVLAIDPELIFERLREISELEELCRELAQWKKIENDDGTPA